LPFGCMNGSRGLGRRRNRLVADADDHIAAVDPAFIGAAAGGDLGDISTVGGRAETEFIPCS
jgi:hypothetical protein